MVEAMVETVLQALRRARFRYVVTCKHCGLSTVLTRKEIVRRGLSWTADWERALSEWQCECGHVGAASTAIERQRPGG
ncbi:MAG TPA: hypothetical protein VNH64_05615 [Parvularculaceae bacterium]|nr:hypothetical protein [Parvularculaceae bacterium]